MIFQIWKIKLSSRFQSVEEEDKNSCPYEVEEIISQVRGRGVRNHYMEIIKNEIFHIYFYLAYYLYPEICMNVEKTWL